MSKTTKTEINEDRLIELTHQAYQEEGIDINNLGDGSMELGEKEYYIIPKEVQEAQQEVIRKVIIRYIEEIIKPKLKGKE